MASFAFDPFAGSAADSKAVVASEGASVADSKAVVASGAASGADSNAAAASGGASEAGSEVASLGDAVIITESIEASQYKISHEYLDLDYSMVVVYP